MKQKKMSQKTKDKLIEEREKFFDKTRNRYFERVFLMGTKPPIYTPNWETVWDYIESLVDKKVEEAFNMGYNDGMVDGVKNLQAEFGKPHTTRNYSILDIVRKAYLLGSLGRETESDKNRIQSFIEDIKGGRPI